MTHWWTKMRFFGVAVLASLQAAAAMEIFVDANASRAGDGSRARPWATLAAARDHLREVRRSGNYSADEAITIWLRPGCYRFTEALELTREDSGTSDAPVIWRAVKPGKVRLQGGIPLSHKLFTPLTDLAIRERLDPSVRDKVLVADLRSLPDVKPFKEWPRSFRGSPAAPWLYVNGVPQTLARWPNLDDQPDSWARFSEVVEKGAPDPTANDPALRKARPGAFVFDDPRPVRWNLAEGVWLLGYWTHDWFDEVLQVAEYDAEKRVMTLAAPHHYGINAGTWGGAQRRFYAFNLIEELDRPGEWYLDRRKQRLYFYPPGKMKKAKIMLAILSEPLIKLTELKHHAFIGLTFEYGHGRYAVEGKNCQAITIQGCRVANMGGGGVHLVGSNNRILSSDLYHLGREGISLDGGDRHQLVPGSNLVENCHIHHYAQFQRTYAAAVYVQGCGTTVRHNLIHDAPHNAILYGGNEHLFEYNEIYRVVLETGDAGAFYTGWDWGSQGNIIRHNYVHHLGGGEIAPDFTMGVYLDDCDCGDTIEGNIFFHAGRAIMVGGGRNNPVLNNLVAASAIGLHLDARGMTWPAWNNPSKDSSWALEEKVKVFNYKNPPWSTRYPHLANILDDSPREPLYNPMRNNLLLDCTHKSYQFDANVMKLLPKLEIENNLVVSTHGSERAAKEAAAVKGFRYLGGSSEAPLNLGFRDLERGDFTLEDRSWFESKMPEFQPIPFNEIGLYRDAYRTVLPRRYTGP